MATKRPRDVATEPWSWRRTVVGFLTVICAAGWLYASGRLGGGSDHWSDNASATATAAAMGRLGLMLAALFVAWPTIQRPMRALPPAVLAGVLVTIGIGCFRPRLLLVLVPVMVVVGGWTTFARRLRRR